MILVVVVLLMVEEVVVMLLFWLFVVGDGGLLKLFVCEDVVLFWFIFDVCWELLECVVLLK